MNKVVELVKDLRTLEKSAEDISEQIDITRKLILEEMTNQGVTQVKTPDSTVSKAKRKVYAVREMEWREWATKQPDLALDGFYITALDKKRVSSHAERWLKETGEVVPGIEASETEYLSIRKADKK